MLVVEKPSNVYLFWTSTKVGEVRQRPAACHMWGWGAWLPHQGHHRRWRCHPTHPQVARQQDRQWVKEGIPLCCCFCLSTIHLVVYLCYDNLSVYLSISSSLELVHGKISCLSFSMFCWTTPMKDRGFLTSVGWCMQNVCQTVMDGLFPGWTRNN